MAHGRDPTCSRRAGGAARGARVQLSASVTQLPASSVSGTGVEPRRAIRLELAAGVVVAAASVAILCLVGADTWFRTDAWDFLLRRPPRSLDSWLRPHGGHLQVPTVGLHRLLYAAFGLDFWPWYYLPHLVGYAALMFYMWRVMLRRGADRLVAFAVYLVLLFLGVSYFLASIAVGGLIVLALLLWVAQRIDAGGARSLGQGVLLAAALVVMVSASSEGVAALAACGIVVLASPAARRWWWSLLPAGLLYVTWYVFYGQQSAAGGIDWGEMGSLPERGLRVLGSVVTRVVGVPGETLAYGVVVALGLGFALWWLVRRRVLRRFDAILAGTTAFYLLMVLAVRAVESGQGVEDRHVYGVVVLLVPLLVPHLRFGARWPAAARVAVVVAVGGALLGYNAWLRVDATDHIIEARSLRLRTTMEQVGGLIAAGEPAADGLTLRDDLGLPAEAGLTVGDVRRVVADGWAPPPVDLSEVEGLRAGLRFLPVAAMPEGGSAAPLALEGVAQGGCRLLAPGDSVRAQVLAAGGVRVGGVAVGERSRLEVVWEDPAGEFRAALLFAPGSAWPGRAVWVDGSRSGLTSGQVLALAAPVGATYLKIENDRPTVVFVCAVGAG